MLLRVAARLSHGRMVGSYVVRYGMVTYDSRVFLGSSGGAAMPNRDARARRQAPPRATQRHSLGLSVENCAGRRLDSTTKEEGDWASTGGEETDCPEREFLFFRSAPQAARSILFLGTGEKRDRLEFSVNES